MAPNNSVPIYEVGKTYDLTFVGTIVKDGHKYLVANDGFNNYNIEPYDYQIEYSAYPDNPMSCFVRKIGDDGNPFFEQTKEPVLRDRYFNFGETDYFFIEEIYTKSKQICYALLDVYGIRHLFLLDKKDSDKRKGDKISLIIKGIIPSEPGKNNARLDFEAVKEEKTHTTSQAIFPINREKTHFGSENEKKEFKSSIVYPAGKTDPDIDNQLGIICRTIAGFMNADGGTLYIGVSDNGHVCGIEGDYSHLNEGEDTFHYKETDDHYLLKITNHICKCLGKSAGTHINMRIEEADGKKYCVLNIKKASFPIWFEQEKLFVRSVVSNRHLKGDAITHFVLERVSKSSFEEYNKTEYNKTEDLIEEYPKSDTEPSARETISRNNPSLEITPTVKKKDKKAWRYISFYDNGEWSFQKEELIGPEVITSAIIPSDAKKNNQIMIIAYENGHVEATYLKKALYGKNGLLPEGKRRGQGLCLDNGKVASAFCANKKDMLLLVSHIAGEVYVKALDVETLGIHDQMGKGNALVREKGATLARVIHIPDEVGARLALRGSGIFIEKNQKYYKSGVKLTSLSANYKNLIDKLIG